MIAARIPKKACAAAVVLHAFLLAALIQLSRKPLELPLKPDSRIWIVTGRPDAKGLEGRKAPTHQHRSGKGSLSKAPLQLGLGPSHSGSAGAAVRPPSDVGGSEGYDVARGMGLVQEGQFFPFFDAIWRKVDSVTTFPNDFVDQRISGSVTVEMVVDQTGKFTGDIKSVRGIDPILNTLAVATLVHALRDPLPKNQWMKDPSMTLVFRFDYKLLGVGESAKSMDAAHVKNILAFQRSSHVNPIFNQFIEELFTRYIPPIIPIPGGFYIDFPHAYLYVKNLIHPPLDEGKLETEKLRLKKEELERFIRGEGQGEAKARD